MTSAPTTPEGNSPPWIGQVLDGRYQIREMLGEGGMGAVYIAEHLSLRKQVALKVIRAEFAGNEEIAARFTREAMATAQLDHPNVASALDYGTLPDGGAYLVTQLVRGRSLESHRSAGVMAWRQACEVGAQIADALAAAHAIGIVHRDLKPDNILLEPRDDGSFLAKVLDFGIARVTQTTGLPTTDLTRMGAVIGTPGYMAPEQAMGEKVDFSVDIYALGVILWECMAGRVLWDGPTVSDLFTAQLAGPAPPLASVVANLPPELSALVDLMLDRNPKRRPESARQVRDALRRMSHGTLIQQPSARPPAIPAKAQQRAPLYLAGGLFAALLVVTLIVAARSEPFTEPDAKSAVPGVTADGGAPPVPKDMADPTGPVRQPGEAIPEAIAVQVQTLLTSDDRRVRKAAADAVLAHTPQDAVPLYARNLAWLDKTSTCEGKKTVIKKMAEAGDPRALVGLRALSKTPRKGCGIFNSEDCNECLRETLGKTIGELEAKPAP
ncbi:MAG: serine/threonine protein kinase [Nannocystis sp.]|uniref:serine/threonine protein kinase n=1 Tax=Nannocystis sp. TaxID=1962667 RepID=UPI002424BFE0|nr:serine/threonine-protein kinase [Nannocystis sp.]MBK9757704.1 serine/threonine protein kinase [Nannocystis sp.]